MQNMKNEKVNQDTALKITLQFGKQAKELHDKTKPENRNDKTLNLLMESYFAMMLEKYHVETIVIACKWLSAYFGLPTSAQPHDEWDKVVNLIKPYVSGDIQNDWLDKADDLWLQYNEIDFDPNTEYCVLIQSCNPHRYSKDFILNLLHDRHISYGLETLYRSAPLGKETDYSKLTDLDREMISKTELKTVEHDLYKIKFKGRKAYIFFITKFPSLMIHKNANPTTPA